MAVLEVPVGRLYLQAVLREPRVFVCRLATLSVLWAVTAAAARAGAEQTKPACALLKACGLAVEGSSCTLEQSRPIGGAVYDAQRCSEPRDLIAQGVSPEAGMGVFVFPFLGGRYRLVYDISGEASISQAKFDYLARHLTLAARLASRFSKTRYTIRYPDPSAKRFLAARADKLAGEAELLFHDVEANRRAYYGWGTSKFGPWKLRGSAYVDIRTRAGIRNPKGVAYDVRIRTAPVNAVVNAIMRLGLFKHHVIGQIEETMRDLVGAAAALDAQGVESVLRDRALSSEEREQIRALAALPD